jgi:carboxyl-terminal processing protease
MILLNKFLIIALTCITFAVNANENKISASDKEVIEKFYRLGIIFDYIDKIYVDEIDKNEVIDNAIKGMLAGLDPHSDYLKPKEQQELMESSSGKFGGLGIVINKKDDLIEVVSPIDDTPAYRAGLKAGDMIIKIGDKAVRGMSLEDGVSLMRGTPTTSVDLTIARKGEKPFKVNIVRDIITITSARGYLLDKDLGYLRISSFQEPTTNLVIKSIDKLIKQNNGKLKSLIIDLRNNPGGLLTSAIQISDAFLDNKELVVYTKGKLKSQFSEFFAKPGDITGGANIVVLINEGSASASEILAGALQDNKRALVIGKKSFGKGSVQTIVELDDGYGLKITTARYYTPSGRSIQAKGIEPDVSLKNFELKIKDEDDLSITEANLDNHIDSSNDKEQAPSFNEDEEISTEEQKIKDLKQDYFVHEAINLLKALDFIKNGK